MSYKNFLLDGIDENIYRLTINNPETLNALSSDVLKEFDSVLDELYLDRSVRVLIITGVERSFVAGEDIAEMREMDFTAGKAYGALGHRVFAKIENAPFVTIAQINGFALGGGLELALACDIRIASNRAKLGQPEVSLGITPGFGATQRLPRLIGRARAKHLLFTGEKIKAEKALELGILSEAVEPDSLVERCVELAKKIRNNSFNAVMQCKTAVDRGMEMPLSSALKYEEHIFAGCFSHNDQNEGMSAFLEKRKPGFE
ncbi:MAG: enoyl-CoA hydratase-related protein [Candidatus Muiribacteriaceae bacterium]